MKNRPTRSSSFSQFSLKSKLLNITTKDDLVKVEAAKAEHRPQEQKSSQFLPNFAITDKTPAEKVISKVRNFFKTLLAFFELSVIPMGILEEIQLMLKELYSISKPTSEVKFLEARLKELKELCEGSITEPIIIKVKEVADFPSSAPPLLPKAEQRFNREIALLAEKDLSQLGKIKHLPKEARTLIIHLLRILKEVDSSIPLKKLSETAVWYFNKPKHVLAQIKKISEFIRTRKMPETVIKRARNAFVVSGSMKSEIMRKLQRFIQEVVKLYHIYSPLFTQDKKIQCYNLYEFESIQDSYPSMRDPSSKTSAETSLIKRIFPKQRRNSKGADLKNKNGVMNLDYSQRKSCTKIRNRRSDSIESQAFYKENNF